MNRTANLSARAALTSPDHRLITVIGAGGKTSILRWIARSRQSSGQRVVITTTTKILPLHDVPTVLAASGSDFPARIQAALQSDGCVVVARIHDKKTGKLLGLNPETINALHSLELADTILVEADGAARKPLKAPAEHEPVIPAMSDLCIAVMGLDAVNQPLSETIVHRHEIFARITGAHPGEPITPAHMIRVATANDGLFKGCPPQCERVIMLNKADIPDGQFLTSEFERELTGNDDAFAYNWYFGSCCQQTVHPINLQRTMSNAPNNTLDVSTQL